MADRDTPRFDNAPHKVSDDKGATMNAPITQPEAACCTPIEQTTCCEPEQKTACCGGPRTGQGCRCR